MRSGAHRAANIMVGLVLVASAGACLTKRTYERFESRPIEAVTLELLEARPNWVRLTLTVDYEGAAQRSGPIEFDPALRECDSVRVGANGHLAEDYLELGTPRSLDLEGSSGEEADRQSDGSRQSTRPGVCTVTIVLDTYHDDLMLAAETAERRIGGVLVEAPANVAALVLLLPAAAVVDVATIVPIAMMRCASGEQDYETCSGIGEMLILAAEVLAQ